MTASSLRVAIRLGTGAARRSRWRSVLVMILIALPVMAMVGAATVIDAVTPTPERTATASLGIADLRVTPVGEGATLAALQGLLPARSSTEPIAQGSDTFVADGAQRGVQVVAANIDGLAKGMFTLLSGRAPSNAGEVAVSPEIAALAGIQVGGTLTLSDHGPVTVVGTLENPMNLRMRVVLADDSLASTLGGPTGVDWLVKLPAGASVADVASAIDVFLAPGVTSATPPSGQPLFQAVTRAAAGRPSDTQTGSIFILGGLALVEAALIASAAFAVSIRRRQRELGLLGAVGAEPRHLATTVLAEATLLGVLGAVLGIVFGAAAALVTGPWLDTLVDRRNPPIAISPPWLLTAGGIGVLAALIAAALPAWTASRVPILAALSGRRPPTAPARRTLRLGLATIVVAFLITLLGTAVAFRSADGSPGLGIGLLLLGAVLGVLGFGACSPWLLERLEGLAARLPLSPRLALRDTARHRSRNGPIVTALLASFAATVAVAAIFSSQQASVAQFYQPSMRDDQLVMNGPGALTAGPQAASDLGAVGAAPLVPATTSDDAGAFLDAPGWEGNSELVIGDENLMRALGAGSAIPDLRTGSVILFSAHAADIQQAVIRSGSGQREGALPAHVVATGQTYAMLPGAVISADVAASLGLRPGVAGMFVMRLPHAVTQADIDHASLLAAKSADTAVNWETGLQRPGDAFRLILVVASLLFALTITGVAVALGEAEARPDQRTLLAIGADPRIRRRITAARAGVLAAIAGVLAVPAGLLPVWGLLATRHVPLVVPLPEVLVAMAVLPVAAVVGAALLSRPISTWSAYRGEGG